MRIFEQFITVTEDDLDELNHVNNVRYVDWVNTIAKAHWEHNATPEMLHKHIWVVLKHNIEYKSSAVLDDTIRLQTYVRQTTGATSIRVVEMEHRETGKSILKSETHFCLMDPVSLRPQRIPQEIADLFH